MLALNIRVEYATSQKIPPMNSFSRSDWSLYSTKNERVNQERGRYSIRSRKQRIQFQGMVRESPRRTFSRP